MEEQNSGCALGWPQIGCLILTVALFPLIALTGPFFAIILTASRLFVTKGGKI